MQTIKIDISAKSIIPVVNAKQGEIGRKIEIVLTNNGEAYQIPANAQITVWYSGASGSGNYKEIGAESAVSISANKITVEMIAQMLSNAGGGYFCLMMSTENGDRIGLWNIPYMVEYVPGSGSAEAKENYTVFAPLDKTLTVSGRAADAGAVGEALKKLPAAGDVVKYTQQDLTEAQKAQARENIGASTYYHTERKEIGVSHEDINSEYIWDLYDALMAKYPDNVQKKEVHNDDGTFTNYEYVISTGEYRTDGAYAKNFGADTDTKKPKYLVLNAIDGQERKTTFSTYRFICDVLNGHNVPKSFLEGAIIKVIPVANPSGFDAFTKWNDNNVGINRNFDWNFTQGSHDFDYDGTDDYTNGASAESEKETQAIAKWLADNEDSDLFIDFHNSSTVNEQVVVIGVQGNDGSAMAQKIAMRGLDRIIPSWRDGFPFTALDIPTLDKETNTIVPSEPKEIIFSNSVSALPNKVKGLAISYAAYVKGIPSIAIETATYYGNYSDSLNNLTAYPKETIALGAEAIGNILLEFYEQAFFGKVSEDMKEINNKIDRALSFRIEKGYVEVPENIFAGSLPTDPLAEGVTGRVLVANETVSYPASNGNLVVTANAKATGITIKIPCSNNAKTIDFHAEFDKTLPAIRKTQGIRYFGSFLGNFYAPEAGQTSVYTRLESQSLMTCMKYDPEVLTVSDKVWTPEQKNNGWVMYTALPNSQGNTDGAQFATVALKAGTYEWIAYYWNE